MFLVLRGHGAVVGWLVLWCINMMMRTHCVRAAGAAIICFMMFLVLHEHGAMVGRMYVLPWCINLMRRTRVCHTAGTTLDLFP